MTKYILQAANRIVFGRKVKKLRGGGILPANIYGKKIKSHAVSVKSTDFLDIFKNAGGSGIVELHLDGKKMPVLIHNISYHPVTGAPLHADFYNVDLKEKVTANIPLELVGESPAVKDKTGVLLTILNELKGIVTKTSKSTTITIDNLNGSSNSGVNTFAISNIFCGYSFCLFFDKTSINDGNNQDLKMLYSCVSAFFNSTNLRLWFILLHKFSLLVIWKVLHCTKLKPIKICEIFSCKSSSLF